MSRLPIQRIEVILDAGANSHRMRGYVEALQDFFAEVESRTNQRVDVRFLDTTQLFHEKTGFLTKELAPDRVSQWPEEAQHLARMLHRGEYEVTPPGEVEAQYQAALRNVLFKKMQSYEPGYLQKRHIEKPEDISDRDLQKLFTRQLASLPRDHGFRESELYREYTTARADAGEISVERFIESREITPEQGRTVTFFVSQDKEALQFVDRAGKQAASNHPGQYEMFSVHHNKAPKLVQEFINQFKREVPAARGIWFTPEADQEKSHAAKIRHQQNAPRQISR